MKEQMVHLAYEVELRPGEKLALPPSLIESVGVGRWLITVQPVSTSVRGHGGLLNSYAPEDEGLYDDAPGR